MLNKEERELLEGLTKKELLERLEMVQKVTSLGAFMQGWDHKEKLRTLSTALCLCLSDSETEERYAELVKFQIDLADVCSKDGIAEKLGDEDYWCEVIHDRLAEMDGETN